MIKDIQVITGCMFAGKTTELLNRIKKTNKTYLLIKPKKDIRNLGNRLTTHDGVNAQALTVDRVSDIFNQLENIEIVAIDEAQFFDDSIIEDINYLVSNNIKLIIAGLDRDYLHQSFGPMQKIMEISNSVSRLKAICNQCGDDAYYSHRLHNSNTQVLIGDSDQYEALCKTCFTKKSNDEG